MGYNWKNSSVMSSHYCEPTLNGWNGDMKRYASHPTPIQNGEMEMVEMVNIFGKCKYPAAGWTAKTSSSFNREIAVDAATGLQVCHCIPNDSSDFFESVAFGSLTQAPSSTYTARSHLHSIEYTYRIIRMFWRQMDIFWRPMFFVCISLHKAGLVVLWAIM